MQAFRKLTRRSEDIKISEPLNDTIQGTSLHTVDSLDDLRAAKNGDSDKSDAISASESEGAVPRQPLAKEGPAIKFKKVLFKRSKSTPRIPIPDTFISSSTEDSVLPQAVSQDAAKPALPPSSAKSSKFTTPVNATTDGYAGTDEKNSSHFAPEESTLRESRPSKQATKLPMMPPDVSNSHSDLAAAPSGGWRGSSFTDGRPNRAYISRHRPLSTESIIDVNNPLHRNPTVPLSAIEKPEPPMSKKPEPPMSKKPEPPMSKKPEPPMLEKPEPPMLEKPEPPMLEKPEPPIAEKPFYGFEMAHILTTEKPPLPSVEKPQPPSVEKPRPPIVERPRPRSVENPRAPSIDRLTSRSFKKSSSRKKHKSASGNEDSLIFHDRDYAAMSGSSEKLHHFNQHRPKGPNRRPPSSVFKENMRNSSESDSNGGMSLGSPSSSQNSLGFGSSPGKDGLSDSAPSKSISDAADGNLPASSILSRVNSNRALTGGNASSSNSSTPVVNSSAVVTSSSSPAPAKSPHAKRKSLLGPAAAGQPAVPWLQELNAKQQRKSLMLEQERESAAASPPVNPKPSPLANKKPPVVGTEGPQLKPLGSSDIIRSVSFNPTPAHSAKPSIEDKQNPHQPDLISTARKVSTEKVDSSSASSSTALKGSTNADSTAKIADTGPTKNVNGAAKSAGAPTKDATPPAGSTAAMVRQLQQNQQQQQQQPPQPNLSSGSRGSIVSVSSSASSLSSSSSNNQQIKPTVQPALAQSIPPHQAATPSPVQSSPLAVTQTASPSVQAAHPPPTLPSKLVQPPSQNSNSHLPPLQSSHSVIPAPHDTSSTKPVIPSPAATAPSTAPPEVPSASTDTATPAGTFMLDEAVNSVLEKVLPKISELESRLEDQNREHTRQLQLLTEELDEERKKRACLEIEMERLKRTMNNYTAHV